MAWSGPLRVIRPYPEHIAAVDPQRSCARRFLLAPAGPFLGLLLGLFRALLDLLAGVGELLLHPLLALLDLLVDSVLSLLHLLVDLLPGAVLYRLLAGDNAGERDQGRRQYDGESLLHRA